MDSISDENSVQGIAGIRKLQGTVNYQEWKFQVKNLLENKNWWIAIHPLQKSDGTLCSIDSDVDRRARTTICMLVDPICFSNVYGVTTAKEAWDNLQKAYEDKGWGRRIQLQRALWECRLEKFKTMEEYISNIVTYTHQLSEIDSKVSDEWIISILLSGLTSYYDPMVMAIDNSGGEINLEMLKSKLIQEANRQKQNNEEVVFLTKPKLQQKNVSKVFYQGPIICYKCGGKGHKASVCPTRNYNDREQKYSLLSTNNDLKSEKWYVDSCCSTHMTNNKKYMSNFFINHQKVIMSNNSYIFSEGYGDIVINMDGQMFTITNVLYVPDLSTSLLSVSCLVSMKLIVNFNENGCEIVTKSGNIMARAKYVGGIYELVQNPIYNYLTTIENNTLNETNQNIWHQRLTHLNKVGMDKLKSMATGLNNINKYFTKCKACLVGKMTRLPFPHDGNRACEILQLVHSDICGPFEVESLGGARYLLIFIDDYSRKTFGYFLKLKSDVPVFFKKFKSLVEKETGKSIKTLRTDNGTEYFKLKSFLEEHGIKHQKTVSYTPQQNGVAERANRTIIDKAVTLLQESHLPKCLWGEAVNTVIYVKNRIFTVAVKGKTPEEVWSGKKIDLSHLRVFGCAAYMHIPKQKRLKLDPKSKPMIFVGYCEQTKGYRLLDCEKKNIVISRDVIMIEDEFPGLLNGKVSVNNFVDTISFDDHRIQNCSNETINGINNITCDSNEIIQTENINSNDNLDSDYDISIVNNEVGNEFNRIPERRYPLRNRISKTFPDHVVYKTINEIVISDEPVDFNDALSRGDCIKWQEAMLDEMKSLELNKTWTLVELPQNKNAIRNKWVFKIKRNCDGEITKYKARLVAKGFSQKYGIDYFETFSPVVKMSTLRMLFSLAINFNWFINHCDVMTAFLYGKLNEEVYMYQPEGFIIKGQEQKVCKLEKAIYGLKQASNAWYREIDTVLCELGYQQLKLEPCVYVMSKDNLILIVAIFVDDLYLFGNDNDEADKLKINLNNKFRLKDLGEARNILGMRLRKINNCLYLDQHTYIQNLIEKFNMVDCNPVRTPLELGMKLQKSETCDVELPYQNLIGSLMYLAVNTRPDITHAVSYLSQFNTCYNKTHWNCAKRILRYLKGTIDLCLKFDKSKNNTIVTGYVDADWGNSSDRRSYTGFVFMIGSNAISWESRKQSSVATSTTEAEYVAMAHGAKEGIYLNNLLNELMPNSNNLPIVMFNDNQSAQMIANNKICHNKTKHIDIKYYFLREVVLDGKISLHYLSTDKMIADIFTKALAGPKHTYFVNKIGLIDI